MPTRIYSNEDGNLNSKSIIVSRTKENSDIDLSFNAKFIGLDSDGSNLRADIFKKSNASAVKQAVRNLLLTNFTEKPFLPRYGGNLSAMLFRLSTEIDDASLEEDIALAIESYEPRAQVLSINSVISADNNDVRVTVRFLVIATLQQETVELNLTRLR